MVAAHIDVKRLGRWTYVAGVVYRPEQGDSTFPSMLMELRPFYGCSYRRAWRKAWRAAGRPVLVAVGDL